ncbi:MAG: hypothetical protein KKC64_00190, partial [Spirochaetes bacterium]|nr:hypothetical protein [Spirochaetota bacterium]
PTLRIPASLTSGSSRAVIPNDVQVFEPFRASLDIAQAVLDEVYNIIETISANPIPDDLETTSDNGTRIVVTYSENRLYKKHINIYKDQTASEAYLIIAYNKNVIKGQIYYNNAASPTPESGAEKIAELLVNYDESATAPVLELMADLQAGTAGNIFATSIYYKGTYSGSVTQVAGGVGYNYVFDAEDPITYEDVYEANHVYMFRAAVDPDSADSKARVELYFPLATSTADPTAAEDIGASFTTLVHTWVNEPNNAEMETILTNNGINCDGTPEEFKADLLAWQTATPTGGDLDSLLFLLDLSNPIAYNDIGYVAHGDVDALNTGDYSEAALGALADIAWPLAPNAIFGIDPTPPTP